MYQEKRQKLKFLLQEREKMTPKAWKSEHDTLIKEQQTDQKSLSRKAVEIAFMEVLENNRKQLALMEKNESHRWERMTHQKKEQEI